MCILRTAMKFNTNSHKIKYIYHQCCHDFEIYKPTVGLLNQPTVGLKVGLGIFF